MKPKIDLEELKSLYEAYKLGFGGNVDYLADSVKDLVEALEEAKTLIYDETCGDVTCESGVCPSFNNWLSRFKKEGGK